MKYSLVLASIMLSLIGCTDSKTTTTEATKPEATAVAFNLAGAPTVMFEVPDMVCESCSGAVHETLAKQPGAREVTVDLETKLATVAVDKKTFDSEAALTALLDKQFSQAKLVGTEKKVPAPAAPEPPAEPSEKLSDG